MRITLSFCRHAMNGALIFAVAGLFAGEAEAQWPRARRVRLVPTSARQVPGVAPSPMLGTFYPDNVVNIRGNFEAGGGYSPLGTYGDTAATLYGPLSAFRTKAAPVTTYQRGYNGAIVPSQGTSFSTPNQPALSPVVYPWRGNVPNAPRNVGTPPQWDSGINWIDLN